MTEHATDGAGQNPLKGIVLRICAATAFAFMAAMVTVGDSFGIHPVEMIFWRFAIGLPPLLLWIAVFPGLKAVKTKRPIAHFGRAVLGFVGMGFGYWALTLLPLAEATAISFAAPLFATILSAVLLAEAVGWQRWGAVIAGFVGVLIVMQPQDSTLPVNGLIIALISAFAISCVVTTIRRLSRTETTLAMVFWFTAISTVALGIVVPFFAQSHSLKAWGVMVLIAVFASAAQFLLTASLKAAPVSVIAPFDYTQLIWAVLLGWMIWSEVPPATTWVGAAIVVASGIYTVMRERKRLRDITPLAV